MDIDPDDGAAALPSFWPISCRGQLAGVLGLLGGQRFSCVAIFGVLFGIVHRMLVKVPLNLVCRLRAVVISSCPSERVPL